MKSIAGICALVVILLIVSSCKENYTPKPKGFFRIAFPEHDYIAYQPENCPYSFEIPVYAKAGAYRDSVAQPCWKYIFYPSYNAELFLSYLPITGNLSDFLEDARTLAFKHAIKADAIDETIVIAGPGVSGMIYDISGSAASPVQFYVTDSVRHFLRGALYFNATPQPDSLAPVIQFLRSDIEHMIRTASWK